MLWLTGPVRGLAGVWRWSWLLEMGLSVRDTSEAIGVCFLLLVRVVF